MKILLSSGFGRLHLAQSADWLSKMGVAVKLTCGWVPSNPNGWLVRLCSKLARRNLSAGMKKRAIVLGRGGELLACAWPEFLYNFMLRVEHLFFRGLFHGEVAAFGWSVFGFHTKKYLRKYGNTKDIVFHVRSGAGHGGAIKMAHMLGIPVLVDHSIAHPAYMEIHLKPEYEKNNVAFDMGLSSSFWQLVSQDCDWADLLLVNSIFVRDTFVEQGYPKDKIRVVYLGTRPDFFGLRHVSAIRRGGRKLKLLFTGNFGFRKGAEYILEAVKLLIDKGYNGFEMDVVGVFSSANEAISSYSKHELPIVFHGPVPQDDLKYFLSSSDIYVFPSLAEGCACSGMEAMAAGLCVVATRESGLPIENGVNGCIVPSKNALAIAENIIWLMEHTEEIERMGASASDLIRTKYTWENYAERVKSIYVEMLNNA